MPFITRWGVGWLYRILLLSLTLCGLAVLVGGVPLGGRSDGENKEMLEVYVVPHSHCDTVWKSNFFEYYTLGSDFESGVRDILTNVMTSLVKDPKKRFVWGDASFLALWLSENGDELGARIENMANLTWKEVVRELVSSGRLEIVHGGWVQHDEGLSNFEASLDTFLLGSSYLSAALGVRPTVAWQLDSFGHSAVTPALLSRLGVSTLITSRFPESVLAQMRRSLTLQGSWSSPHHEGSSVFLHTTYDGTYSIPQGLDTKYTSYAHSGEDHIRAMAQIFADHCWRVSAGYRTRNIMVMWGDDFRHSSPILLDNLDVILAYINSHSDGFKMRARYATVSEYIGSVKADLPPEATPDISATLRMFDSVGDAFPYNDNKDYLGIATGGLLWDNYWSGAYSTRPRLKRAIRRAEHTSRVLNTLHALNTHHTGAPKSNEVTIIDALVEGLLLEKMPNKKLGANHSTMSTEYLQQKLQETQELIAGMQPHKDTLMTELLRKYKAREGHLEARLKHAQALERLDAHALAGKQVMWARMTAAFLQHHDITCGTIKSWLADQVIADVDALAKESSEAASTLLASIACRSSSGNEPGSACKQDVRFSLVDTYVSGEDLGTYGGGRWQGDSLHMSAHGELRLVAVNTLAWSVAQLVGFKVRFEDAKGLYGLFEERDGKEVEVQAEEKDGVVFLMFQATVPALGFRSFVLRRVKQKGFPLGNEQDGWAGCGTSEKVTHGKQGVQLRVGAGDTVTIEMHVARACSENGKCSGPYVRRSLLTNGARMWIVALAYLAICLAVGSFLSRRFFKRIRAPWGSRSHLQTWRGVLVCWAGGVCFGLYLSFLLPIQVGHSSPTMAENILSDLSRADPFVAGNFMSPALIFGALARPLPLAWLACMVGSVCGLVATQVWLGGLWESAPLGVTDGGGLRRTCGVLVDEYRGELWKGVRAHVTVAKKGDARLQNLASLQLFGIPLPGYDGANRVISTLHGELTAGICTGWHTTGGVWTDGGLSATEEHQYYWTRLFPGNIHPAAGAAGLREERGSRMLWVHAGGAVGVSSGRTGCLDVMMERRHLSDDEKGLQEGVDELAEEGVGGPSFRVGVGEAGGEAEWHRAGLQLRYPVQLFVQTHGGSDGGWEYSAVREGLGDETHIVQLDGGDACGGLHVWVEDIRAPVEGGEPLESQDDAISKHAVARSLGGSVGAGCHVSQGVVRGRREALMDALAHRLVNSSYVWEGGARADSRVEGARDHDGSSSTVRRGDFGLVIVQA